MRYFETTTEFIKEAMKKGKIFVHCFAGVSRSVACVIAYLMDERKMSLTDAYELIRSKRSIICPNYGF
jgi:protein-tyrosine phosphatase